MFSAFRCILPEFHCNTGKKERVVKMKKVLLLGDSIRMGYDQFVCELLKDKAEVVYPPDNGRFAQYTLRQLQDWKAQLHLAGDDVDLVHWNNGLWDVGHLGIGETGEADADTACCVAGYYTYEEENLTPPDFYAHMIRRVHNRIRTLFPRAEIIFAYTTPVLEDRIPSFLCRRNAEIRSYNEIAKTTLSEFGVQFNDLYTFAEKHVTHLHRDWVHYNEEGSRKIAEEIAEVIRRTLAL